VDDDFEALRARVMAGPALQQRLDRAILPDVFAAELRALAAEMGLRLDPRRLDPQSRPAPVRDGRLSGAVRPSRSWAPPGWLPVRLLDCEGGGIVDWAYFGDAVLAESFYEDSARRAAMRPFNRLFRHAMRLDDFVAGAQPDDGVAPQGFLFHMSRCGSTLAVQMLGRLPGTIALSEPGPLDALVRLAIGRTDLSEQWRIAALRAMVAALARKRSGEHRCFVKLDSWHILALPLLRRAFPDVPWVYLFREPVEVLVSHMRMRGYQTVPALMPPGLYALDQASTAAPEHLCAGILAQFHTAAIAALEAGDGIAIDYADLPGAVAARVAPHFGLALSDAERAMLERAARGDAKAPDRAFTPDASSKQAQASPAVRAAAREHLSPLHERLRALGGARL